MTKHEMLAAISRKFKTRRELFAALGLDPKLLGIDESVLNKEVYRMAYDNRGRARDDAPTPAEHSEMLKQKIRECCDSEEFDPAQILEILLSSPDETGEVFDAIRSAAQDSRGPRAWASDRRELRRAADVMRNRKPRRFGADNPQPFRGMPETGGSMYEGGEDRRRAHDYAYDTESTEARFDRLFGPGASSIGRL